MFRKSRRGPNFSAFTRFFYFRSTRTFMLCRTVAGALTEAAAPPGGRRGTAELRVDEGITLISRLRIGVRGREKGCDGDGRRQENFFSIVPSRPILKHTSPPPVFPSDRVVYFAKVTSHFAPSTPSSPPYPPRPTHHCSNGRNGNAW